MSVRRLAEDKVQPPTFAFSAENADWAALKIAEYPTGRQQSAVIPVLWRAQEQEGWISRPAIEAVASMLGMAYIRVLEVATFYTQFQLQPVGTMAHVQVCGTTPCMLRGAEDLRAVCERKIHPSPHHRNDTGTLSWEEVECLGACVNAPMIAVGNDTYEDLTPARLEEILEAFDQGRGSEIPTGPQVARTFAAAQSGRTTLLEAPSARRDRPTPLVPPDAAVAAAAPAPSGPAPTTPGKKREVPEESAPALKGPQGSPKVSEVKAETERQRADSSANADGQPNRAMRETATGAESPAGKLDGGKATGEALFEQSADPADDLKLITGVGPVLEARLNALGITKWAQVAKLTPEQIVAIEGRLNFRGRVTRDNWLAQADALAAGGVSEYVRRFGKEPR